MNNDSLTFLRPIMQRCGAQGSPEEFHAAVNVIFHGYESEVYDQLHQDMWTSLPPLFELFAADCARSGPLPHKIDLLDIGCGTGLASDSILKSQLGPRISSVDLLDTSPKMLAKSSERSKSWNVPARTFEGLLDALPSDRRYHLIVTCSVLHHVPDISGFLAAVARLQPAGGIFLHLQDPNAAAANDPELKQRMDSVSRRAMPEWAARLSPRRIAGRLWREITGRQGDDYISKTNRELLQKRVIQTPLSTNDLFSVTDIHVHDNQGISVAAIASSMPGYDLVSEHSYGFYGLLKTALPADLQLQEDRLLAAGAANGFHAGAAWRKKT